VDEFNLVHRLIVSLPDQIKVEFNPDAQEVELGGQWFEVSPSKILVRSHLENKLVMDLGAYNPRFSGGRGRRIMVLTLAQEKVQDPI
jgi:hypothetical protein